MQSKFDVIMKYLKTCDESFSGRSASEKALYATKNFEILEPLLWAKFQISRLPKAPQQPATVPDEVVSIVLYEYFGVASEKLNTIKLEHQQSMGAENIVGELLERYLASVLEPTGWVWCSGDFVKAVDFIKYNEADNTWHALQVKNRDNTENSSSSAIRNGTDIKKWFRTFAKTGLFNWHNFPDPAKVNMDEEKFRKFVIDYLRRLKASS